MIDVVELICKRLHMPYPNVRIPANMRVAIGPPALAEALCARGFFEKVSEEILQKEREAEAKPIGEIKVVIEPAKVDECVAAIVDEKAKKKGK